MSFQQKRGRNSTGMRRNNHEMAPALTVWQSYSDGIIRHNKIAALRGLAFSVAVALAAAVLLVFGADERGLSIALRFNARFSFLFFWLAYAGGSLAALYGGFFDIFARNRREFGLAFAAAHSVHLALVVWLYRIAHSRPIPNSSAFLFG